MNGKENIINKILTDADAKCAKIVSTAQAQAQAIIDDANRVVARDREALQCRLDATVAERNRNRKANAELAAKKYKLSVKQQLVSRAYDLAYEQIVNLKDKDRLALIGSLLDKYAEKGETVYVTQADAKSVTQTWLNGFEKQLKLGKKYLKADGGVVLEGDGYEKDLTYSSVLRLVREQTENKVAATILGDNNE